MFSPVVLLSLIVFLPAVAGLVLCFFPKGWDWPVKYVSLAVTVVVFLLTVCLLLPAEPGGTSARFALGVGAMQATFAVPWIEAFHIDYFLGMDGISLPLVLLTSFLSVLAMWTSFSIQKHVKAYCALFLLLETGMLGVFLALDFFLFYVFWEVMLLPMYFLIGIWGGPRREYAAIKFFLFTLAGSVLMLVALLMLYFASDLTLLSPEQLAAAHVPASAVPATPLPGDPPIHTFNILALAELGQLPYSPFSREVFLGQSLQWWAFLLLFVGFVIKLPAVPVHTWLPDAHVEAPTPISMILAGVLLKMGGYGVIRICYPICPEGGFDLAWMVAGVGVLSMVYGALAAMAQTDFKRLVAYSSVSHMGYVLLGVGVWSVAGGNQFVSDYWRDYWAMGMSGAVFQMIAHGLSSAGMFFLVGVIYDRVHHREIDQFGGLFGKMPTYTAFAMIIFFAALGLPGMCGFIGEALVVLSAWNYSAVIAIVAASVMILTAGYILWTIQRVYLGPKYKGPHEEWITPMSWREIAIATPLTVLAVVFGVYPSALLNYVTPTVERTVGDLTDWTLQVEAARSSAEAERASGGESQPADLSRDVSFAVSPSHLPTASQP